MALSLFLALLMGTTLAGCERPATEQAADTQHWDGFLRDVQKTHRQHWHELIVRHFFRNRRGGVFVDVGAAHYKQWSTTYFLEDELGWSGIAVDALTDWAAGYETHRPRTKFFSYIVTDRTGAAQPFYLLGGLGFGTASKERADRLDSDSERDGRKKVEVPTTTLDDLLDRNGVTEIDFLSMDIEAGEPAALAGFDIERFRPELVGIEALPEVQDAILQYFDAHGYRRLDDYLEYSGRDWYFAPKG